MDKDFELQLKYEAETAAAKKKDTVEAGATPSSNPYEFTDATGTKFEWDVARKAWFPKLDDEFIARYQASYGTYSADDNGSNDVGNDVGSKTDRDNEKLTPATTDEVEDDKASVSGNDGGKRKINQEPTWFDVDDEHNTSVYVSNLPLDTTDDDFVTLMKKCGLVMKADDNVKFKIKLYRDSEGNFKGDALCNYCKVESVQLALQILDGYDFNGKVIKVERAKFTMKGAFDPKKKRKRSKQNKEKMKKKMEKLFAWNHDTKESQVEADIQNIRKVVDT